MLAILNQFVFPLINNIDSKNTMAVAQQVNTWMATAQVARLFSPLFTDPTINLRVLGASLVIHILGLASAFYVTLVFGRYLTHGLDSTLLTLTVGAFLAMILEHALRRVRFRMVTALTVRRERELSDQTLSRLLAVPPTMLEALDPQVRTSPSRLIDQVAAAITPANVLALLDAPFALVFVLVLIVMAWPLGLLSLLLALFTVAGIYFHGLGLRETTKEMQVAGQQHAQLLASADRLDTVRIANAGPLLNKRGANRAGFARLIRHRLGHRQDRLQGFMQAMSAILSITTIALGAKLVISGGLDYGALFGANILAMRMLAMITRPAQSASQILAAAQSLGAIETFLALPEEAKEGTRLNEFGGQLEFKDLAFAHSGGVAPLFEGMNLRIGPGQVVVITGGNGAGKTSFARLLAGLLEPSRGAIYVDGVDLRQLAPFWWHRQMVYLPQEPEFLDGPLRENLLSLSPKMPPEGIDRLLQRTGIKEFVDRHPKGLDMPILQGGRQLSTGIRRRLALTRAMATFGKLVVIDEPDEGLDAAGRETIHQLLADFHRQGRTILIMAQQVPPEFVQLATIINLDAKPVPAVVLASGVAS